MLLQVGAVLLVVDAPHGLHWVVFSLTSNVKFIDTFILFFLPKAGLKLIHGLLTQCGGVAHTHH